MEEINCEVRRAVCSMIFNVLLMDFIFGNEFMDTMIVLQ